MVAAYILYFLFKYFIRAICIEETNSLAQILCTKIVGLHKKCITLNMNKMLVAFTFRPLPIVLYTISCIKNPIELKRKNNINTLIYLTTISVPPIYITGPLIKVFHCAIFHKFFHILLYIYGLCFTIHVIKL